ncbi:uncharacterized protein LOC107760886 [Nicotiana tabacum]|uniref:Uncharacterized protein LOC107760886 n=1 Tax=Nicotiana tabacum TaxID=4097 RepID=A0A1S3X3C2_TOBAC
MLNVIGVSFKRRDQLRDHQAELLEKLLESGELQSGKGLNQVLEVVECEGSEADDRLQAEAFLSKINAFDFVFLLHLMLKERLQVMREDGWVPLMDEVSSFCVKHDIVLQELNSHFDIVSGNLLLRMASLNPVNSFAKQRIMTLAKYYLDEFGELKLRDISHQLDTLILHMRRGDLRFSDLKGIGDLAKALVEANLAESYSLVYLLVKLTLILPVATATMERAFSSMKYIKDKLCSSISDTFLNDCLVCYFEKKVFINVNNDAIIDRFQNMKVRRVQI